MRLDLHTHILPENWPDLRARYGYGGWVQLEHCAPCRARMLIDNQFFREIESNCWDPAVRMRDCDACGVSMQTLSTVPVMFSYWAKPVDALDLSQRLNDHIGGVVHDFPRRFTGLGTIPLQSPALAIRELERCVSDLGLSGVQIGSNVQGPDHYWNLGDPALLEVFAAAESLGAAIFVHPWNMMGKERMSRYWLPWLVGMPAETSLAICSMIFGGVFERLPRLRVCFAHGGGSFPYTLGRIDHGFRERPDLCAIDNSKAPSSYLNRFYVDSLVHDCDALRFLVNRMGAERVALGSDYPFPLGERCPGALVESMSDLTAVQKRRILAETAAEFLNLDLSTLEPASAPASTTST
jgi:aminocarboxymuconate-semialdehyde decarboxylase